MNTFLKATLENFRFFSKKILILNYHSVSKLATLRNTTPTVIHTNSTKWQISVIPIGHYFTVACHPQLPSSHTVWKLRNYYTTNILREINFSIPILSLKKTYHFANS